MKENSKLPEGKFYYSISEVSDYFGVTHATLRHWEASFDCISPRKTSRGDRIYSANDIEDIRLIYTLLKEQKYTIKGAQEYLKTSRRSLTNRLTALSTLRAVRNELEKLKKSL